MDTPVLTDERLRNALNANQISRERMCLAILKIDRNYTNMQPRRPYGGPDGGRDIECNRGEERCFGAVGFINNVSDSPGNKRSTLKKFKSDLQSALNEDNNLHAFVFFTNVDLTPKDIKNMEEIGRKQNLSFVDIYHRERMRIALDSAEGLAIRYQYLGISLSEAEQAAFFSRFGNDLEILVRGGFDSIEQKLDQIEFNFWKQGFIRKMICELSLKEWENAYRDIAEHFRVLLVFRRFNAHEASFIFGERDDFSQEDGGRWRWYYGEKTFFWRIKNPQQEAIWVPQRELIVKNAHITSFNFGIAWDPISNIYCSEFEGLTVHLLVSENIKYRIDKIHLMIDDYLFIDHKIESREWSKPNPALPKWPVPLTDEENRLEWWGLYPLTPFVLDMKQSPTNSRR
jgi:hypothetical protein